MTIIVNILESVMFITGVTTWSFVAFAAFNYWALPVINKWRGQIRRYFTYKRILKRINYRKFNIDHYAGVAIAEYTPMEWLALYTNRHVDLRLHDIKALVDYKKDGVVKQILLSCHLTSKGQRRKDEQARYRKH